MPDMKYTLCDYKECPLHDNCNRYCPEMDKTKTDHFGAMPYKNGKCSWQVPLTEEDIIDRVNKILYPKLN